jgi:putative redox protein
MQSKVVWKDGMAFEAELEGFSFMVDAQPEHGGRGFGPAPKGLALTSLAGCTAMDVIAILTKMRIAPKRFEVAAEGVLAEEHPKRFTDITVTYRFEGDDLPVPKLLRAIELSEQRYCGVAASLRPGVPMHHEVYVNGEPVTA